MSHQVEQERSAVKSDRGETNIEFALDVEAAFVEHEAKLLRYAHHLLGSRGPEAEDIVQEAFLRLHTQVQQNKADRIRDVRVWLFRVTHNLAMDTGRTKTRRKKLKGKVVEKVQQKADEDQVSVDALGQMARAEACDRAMGELSALPEAQRSVVVLKILEGLTFKQIAKVTGVSASSACGRLRDAMETLSTRLKRDGVI